MENSIEPNIIKDPGKNLEVNTTNLKEKNKQRQRTKIKLNLTQNRFERLETMDTSNPETTNKQTKQKSLQNEK